MASIRDLEWAASKAFGPNATACHRPKAIGPLERQKLTDELAVLKSETSRLQAELDRNPLVTLEDMVAASNNLLEVRLQGGGWSDLAKLTILAEQQAKLKQQLQEIKAKRREISRQLISYRYTVSRGFVELAWGDTVEEAISHIREQSERQ